MRRVDGMNGPTTETRLNGGDSEPSITDLLSGLVEDARDLAVAHVDGLRLEVREELTNLKRIVLLGAIAIAVFAVGAILVGIAGAQALATYTDLPSWAAYAIVAGVLIVAGIVSVFVARSKAGPEADLVPERGLARARRDARWVAQRTREAVTTS